MRRSAELADHGLSNKADQSAFDVLEGVVATSTPDGVDLKLSNCSSDSLRVRAQGAQGGSKPGAVYRPSALRENALRLVALRLLQAWQDVVKLANCLEQRGPGATTTPLLRQLAPSSLQALLQLQSGAERPVASGEPAGDVQWLACKCHIAHIAHIARTRGRVDVQWLACESHVAHIARTRGRVMFSRWLALSTSV